MRNTFFIGLFFIASCSSTITAPPVSSSLKPAAQSSAFSSFPQPVPVLSSQPDPSASPATGVVVPDTPSINNPNASTTPQPPSNTQNGSTEFQTPSQSASQAPSQTTPGRIPFGTLPDNFSIDAPYAPPGAFEGSYDLQKSFLVDQDTFNSWQAANITSNGEHLFVTAVDDAPSKGTLIKMDLAGEEWSDQGSSILSKFTFGTAGYIMKKTIRGVGINTTGQLLISDPEQGLYVFEGEKLTPYNTLKLADANDVTFAHGSYFVVSQGVIQQIASDFKKATPFGEVTGVKALTTNPEGDLYAATTNAIVKLDAQGTVSAKAELKTAPRDLAVDAEGNMFALYAQRVEWWSDKGEAKGIIGEGDMTSPVGMVWAAGALYVADAGTSSKDSAILQFR